MRSILKTVSVCAISLYASMSLADVAPMMAIAHNDTNVEANAFREDGTPSPMPMKPHSTLQVPWFFLKMACGQPQDNWCSALIKVGTDTANPVTLGTVKIHLLTGEIQPKELHVGGYSAYVNGPGEATLVKD